jgi:hypothetical protein
MIKPYPIDELQLEVGGGSAGRQASSSTPANS